MDFETIIRQRKEQRARLAVEIHHDLANYGLYVTACDNGRVVTVTPSTRSYAYQITNFYDGQPTGHIDANFTNLAAELQDYCGPGFVRQDPQNF